MNSLTQKPTIAKYLREHADSAPERPAFVFLKDGANSDTATYSQLDRAARRIAAMLLRCCKPGDRAVICCGPGLAYVQALFGCLYAGIVAVPLYPPDNAHKREFLRHVVEDCGARLVLCDSRASSLLKEALQGERSATAIVPIDHASGVNDEATPEIRAGGERLAYLQYTSGSTGTPKGVRITQANVLANLKVMAHFSEGDEIFVNWVPPHHDLGLVLAILCPVYLGSLSVLIPPARFMRHPLSWLEAITRFRGTVAAGPNFAFDLCVDRSHDHKIQDLDLRCWRLAVNGAEAVQPETLRSFAATFAPAGFRREAFLPCYGLAESTVFVSGGSGKGPLIEDFDADLLSRGVVAEASPNRKSRTLVSCGRAGPGHDIRIVDFETSRSLEEGRVGEIWVNGPSVGDGYWRRVAGASDEFEAHLPDLKDVTYLRTGDLGFQYRGELFICGRHKDVIVVRGCNFAPQDIERVVERCHPHLRRGTCAAFSISSAAGVMTEQLVVSVEVTRQGLKDEPGQLIAVIREAVATAFELNATVVVLLRPGESRRTTSGKIQRRRTREDYLSGTLRALNADTSWKEKQEPTVPPTTPTEARLARVWREVLGEDSVGRTSHFGALGGDSLSAVRVASRVEAEFGIELPTRVLFDAGPLSACARWIDENAANCGARQRIERSGGTGPLPLSFPQQRLWLAERLDPTARSAHNISAYVQLRGSLDQAALHRALTRVIERHEILRTAFTTSEEEAVQIVEPPREFPLVFRDLSDIAEDVQKREIRDLRTREATTPFDLASAPLVRARLLCLAAKRHVLLITMHHIVADGWSMELFVQELRELYTAYARGLEDAIPAPELQYGDYAVWQRKWLAGERLTRLVEFWNRKLDGAPIGIDLPRDHIPSGSLGRSGSIEVPIAHAVARRIVELGRSRGGTPYMTFLALFVSFLARISGQSELIIGTPVAGRTHVQTERLIGFFVNLLLLRIRVRDDDSFESLLEPVRAAVLEAQDHQELPFEKLVEHLSRRRTRARFAAVQVAFALEHRTAGALQLPDLEVDWIAEERQTAQVELSLLVRESHGDYFARFEYSTESFEERTIKRWANRLARFADQVIEDRARPVSNHDITIKDESSEPFVPHSVLKNQQVTWAHLRMYPQEAAFFNLYDAVHIRGRVDEARFAHAVQEAADNTVALRLGFSTDARGLLVGTIGKRRTIDMPFVDLSGESDPMAAAQQWIGLARSHSIDPTAEVPLRYALLKLSEEHFIWYRHHHHLLLDAVGLTLLSSRVLKAYSAQGKGAAAAIASDIEQYREYLRYDQEYRYSGSWGRDRDYWRRNSNSATPVTLSVRGLARNVSSSLHQRIVLDHGASRALVRIAAELKIGTSRLLFGALFLYLRRVTGVDDPCVGLTFHGRLDALARDLVAWCASIVPIQLRIGASQSVRSILLEAAKRCDEGIHHSRFHLEDIRRLWSLGPSAGPLFNIVVNFVPAGGPLAFDAGQAQEVTLRAHESYVERDLSVWFKREGPDLVVSFIANPQRYEPWELEAHAKAFGRLLEGLGCPGALDGDLDQVSLLDEADLGKMEPSSSGRSVPRPGRPIHESFEVQALRAPDAIAVIWGEQHLTYGALDAISARLANALRRRSVGRGSRVALWLERRAEMVIAILGILRAGAAYVPLDLSHPPIRVREILEECRAELVITTTALMADASLVPTPVLEIDSASLLANEHPAMETRGVCGREDAVYVIYTSGSTGRPKGVVVTHSAVENLVLSHIEEIYGRSGCGELRVGLNAPIAFDASVSQLWMLLAGSTICIVPEDSRKAAAPLFRFLKQERIDVLGGVPGHIGALLGLRGGKGHFPRYLLLGGEAVDQTMWTALQGERDLIAWNCYGPTECTGDSIFCDIRTAGPYPVIGRPLPNTHARILDASGSPVPRGLVGEICIGGTGVAAGYFGCPGATAERFIADAFGSESRRLYRTGDLGRIRPDGSIEYIGRADDQIKIRGFRVELGEIETEICRHPGIANAVVIAPPDPAGEKRLVAYVTPRPGQTATALVESVRNWLRTRLPGYMLPSAFVVLDQLPRTVNGKVDRRALPEPDTEVDRCKYEPPQGEVEEALAQMWEELLHATLVSRHDNFFERGGHSLAALRLTARILQKFSCELPLRALFESPTLAELAGRIDAIRRSAAQALLERAAGSELALLESIEALSDQEVASIMREIDHLGT